MKFPVKSVGGNLRGVISVHKIVEKYGDCKGDYLTNTIDLLVDIHHYCDAQGWSLDELIRRVHDHYVEEIGSKCVRCSITFDPTDEGCEGDPDICVECRKSAVKVARLMRDLAKLKGGK